MGEPCSWPTAVAPTGPVAMGSLHWQSRGRSHLTVVVKARFALRHDATMVMMKAITARNAEQVSNAAEEIDKACESCHQQYWYPERRK